MGKIEKASASTIKDHQYKELVIDISNDWDGVLWTECCIYKVPRDLRKLNEKVYTPQFISIGPLHHGDKQLAEMEKQKLIYLCEFFKRTNCKVTWMDFVSILGKEEQHIRRCYAEKSELCSNDYVKMILFDAVFIIEHFIRVVCERELPEDDYMLKNRWVRNGIRQDLALLENQLPYFVLDALFKSAVPDNCPLTFRQLTLAYFNITPDIRIPDQMEVLHFTDLLRYVMSYRHPKPKDHSSIEKLPSAAKLHEAGVKFKGIKNVCLTDVSFKEGMLIMPQVTVEDRTELIIRNLMALEQCHYPDEAYICNYISLMDFLIKNAEDVDLLVEKRVIIKEVGSNEEVANMVNKLCKNTIESNFYFHDICDDLNKHYKKRGHRAMKTLRSVYFSNMKTLRSVYFANIWRGTSTIAAVVLLVMTLLQTINSFRQLP